MESIESALTLWDKIKYFVNEIQWDMQLIQTQQAEMCQMPTEPCLYREIDGALYVLETHAAKEILGASNDALVVVYHFLKAYRPDDNDLHNAVKSLLRDPND